MSELTKVGFAEYGEELLSGLSESVNVVISGDAITYSDAGSGRLILNLINPLTKDETLHISINVSGLSDYLEYTLYYNDSWKNIPNKPITISNGINEFDIFITANTTAIILQSTASNASFNGIFSVKEVIHDPNKRYLVDHGKGKHNRFAEIEASRCTGFNGVDNNIPFSSVQFSNTDSYTVSFKVDNVDRYFSGNGFSNYILFNNTSRQLTVRLGNTSVLTIQDNSIIDGETTITVIIENGQEVYYYRDGVFVGAGSFSYPLFSEWNLVGGIGLNTFYNGSLSSLIVIPQALAPKQVKYLYEHPELSFSHFNVNDAYKTNKLPDITAELNMPLIEKGKYKIDYSKVFGTNEILSFTSVTQGTETSTYSNVGNNVDLEVTEIGGEAFRPMIKWDFGNSIKDTMYDITFDLVVHSGIANLTATSAFNIGSGNGSTSIGLYEVGTHKINFVSKANGTDGTVRLRISNQNLYNISVNNIAIKPTTAYELANYTTASDITGSGMNTALLAPDGKMDSALHGPATLQIPNSKHGSTTQEVTLAENETITKLGFDTYNNLIKEN